MRKPRVLISGLSLPLVLMLSACGGDGGGGVASTPTPTPVVTTPAPVTPAPAVNYDTAEYQRSGAAVQAKALAAYNAGATGAGVTVGVIDSGVDQTSAEFAGRISAASRDLVGNRGLQDVGGHGTAVSDVLLGAKNDTGIQGVAFGATLLVLRTDSLGQNGASSSCTPISSTNAETGCSHGNSAIAAALDLAVAQRAKVVNISLGGNSSVTSTLKAAIDRATAAGTIIVMSAGNNGVSDPANAVNPDAFAQIAIDPVARGLVIVAGAVDANNALADFSNKAGNSAAFYLAALGVRVRAVEATGTTYLFSGTSFSAPVISGAVALLAQAFPNLTSAQIVSLLYRTADDLGVAGVDATYGNGALNITRAFQPQGASALANSVVPVSLTNNATLSSAMGDAAQGGLGAVIRDEYGRNFAVDLGSTIRHAPRTLSLTSALGIGSRSLVAGSGHTTIAVSIAGQQSYGTDGRLLLTRGEAEQARVIAGAVAMRMGKNTQVGLGIARSADGLAEREGEARPAFMIADSTIGRAPIAAFALRQRVGGIGIGFSAESGNIALWQPGEVGPMSDGIRRYRYDTMTIGADYARGPATAALKLGRMHEDATVLGARFGPALGGGGATTWFADAKASVVPLDRWRLSASVRRGWTQVSGGALREGSTLVSQSLGADIARSDLLLSGDSLALRYSEPTRIMSGGLRLLMPGFDGVAQTLSLAPEGHERDVEAVYARPIGGGFLTANAFWRQQPDNYLLAPDDVGGAVRYSVAF